MQMPDTKSNLDNELIARLQMLPKYRVLLHNDDIHDMDYVVRALLKSVPQLNSESAYRIMLEAHSVGESTVIVCPRETAEFYSLSLRRKGLASTMEPA